MSDTPMLGGVIPDLERRLREVTEEYNCALALVDSLLALLEVCLQDEANQREQDAQAKKDPPRGRAVLE